MKRNALFICFAAVFACVLFALPTAFGQTEADTVEIAVTYCTVECDSRPIMAEYSDQWLLAAPNEFNHRLMQASFVLAVSSFRDKTRDMEQKDFNVLNFFSRAGFIEPRTDDYNKATSIDTIASAMAYKKAGDTTLIAVAVSGNNYQNEWLSNFTLSDEERAEGFNTASAKVMGRIREYIGEHQLSGPIRLWISGYSRAAAIANITAADATDSGLFDAVFCYTIGTPRTTRDEDADRFDNIFNVINPFDPVPMVPFPEWGYRRYGTDLYLPSIETDSDYYSMVSEANEVSMKVIGAPVSFNPQVNTQLHTVMDFLLFYVRSARSYKDIFQSGILDLWTTREYKTLLVNIANYIDNLDDITFYEMKEFYYFLDYLCQIAYSSFRGQKFHPDDLYWDPGLSIQENLMHEHYDSAYLVWIFSSEDPDKIYMKEPQYIHYTVLGDVDVDLFDSSGAFIERIDSSGDFLFDPEYAQIPDFSGEISDTLLYAQRNGELTFIVLPADQTFSAVIRSHSDQEVRYSFVEYTVGAIHGDVRYIYYDELSKGDTREGIIDLNVVERLSEEDLAEKGFLVVEPWSRDIVYSPSALMRLENGEIFHPSPLFFLTLASLTLLMAGYVLIILFAGTRTAVKTEVGKIRARKASKG